VKGGAANRRAANRGAANRRAANRRHVLVAFAVACALSACHTAPPKDRPATLSEPSMPNAEMTPPAIVDQKIPEQGSVTTKDESPEVASCSCADNAPKPAPKRRPKPVVQALPPAPPPAAPEPAGPREASVKSIEEASASILGKKVRGQDGDDLGRVVDILADRQGRVRIAIIDFGGFLGVGNRRIAVDWSLLKFQPSDVDAPVILNVSKSKLEATPEYKGAERPLALMAPAAAVSTATAPK